MARPSTTADLTDYERAGTQLATFELSEFGTNPAALAAYAAFIRALTKDGGVVEAKHGTATIRRPKSDKELDEALESKQSTWDANKKRYSAVRDWINGDDTALGGQSWKDYEAYGLRTWALAEGREVFALISATDDVRKAARDAMGVDS